MSRAASAGRPERLARDVRQDMVRVLADEGMSTGNIAP